MVGDKAGIFSSIGMNAELPESDLAAPPKQHQEAPGQGLS
jgi:hypothetical protein